MPDQPVFIECDAAMKRSLAKEDAAHKYVHGHALVLSGGAGRTGAARLAARGALRIGAGLVTLGVPPSAQQEAASQLTAIMLRRIDGSAALAEVLEDRRLNAVCLGPALGLARARDLVPTVCGVARSCGTVLDADALSAYAEQPLALLGMLHPHCVLTPHEGEFSRLFPDLSDSLGGNETLSDARIEAVRAAACRAGCVVLLKGPHTIIATPEGQCRINPAVEERAAPWLATAGSGDVLAGFIAGLLARGFEPLEAASTATWLHMACARRFGPGLIAEDLPEVLPRIFRAMAL